MSEPKFYRRKLRLPKPNDSSSEMAIPADLWLEEKKRRIEIMNRENVARRIITLPRRTVLRIRFKLFLKRLWTKITK